MDYSQFNLYFGDLHGHSNLSLCGVCIGRDLLNYDIYIHSSLVMKYLKLKTIKPEDTLDELYDYAKNQAKLDFVAVTDHDFSMSEEMWALIRKKASDWYSPGKFVTFSAYEWTSAAYGHRNVYFLTDEGPLIRCVEYGSRPYKTKCITPRELWSRLRKAGVKAITIPHHPPITQFPIDWEYYDPEFDRAVEIASLWGVFEYYRNPLYCVTSDNLPRRFVLDALELGYKLGFVGGSDSHDCMPGSSFGAVIKRNAPKNYKLNSLSESFALYFYSNPIRPYLTAIYARGLTRESLFEAIVQRRTYALIGSKVRLEFRIDDHIMGEEIKVDDPNYRPTIDISVEGETDLDRIELVKNGKVILKKFCKGKSISLKYVDESTPERRYNYYYVRVFQRNGSRAWSSPIWVIYEDLGKLEARFNVNRNMLILKNVGKRELRSIRVATLKDYKAINQRAPTKLNKVSQGAFFWLEQKEIDIVILKARFKSNTPVNFRGSIKLDKCKRYTVKSINFAITKYGGDLFIDDYKGYIEWDITPSSRLNNLDIANIKGLDIIMHISPFEGIEGTVEVFQDGEMCPECTFLGDKPVNSIPFKIIMQGCKPFIKHLVKLDKLPSLSEVEISTMEQPKYIVLYPCEIDDFGLRAKLINIKELVLS